MDERSYGSPAARRDIQLCHPHCHDFSLLDEGERVPSPLPANVARHLQPKIERAQGRTTDGTFSIRRGLYGKRIEMMRVSARVDRVSRAHRSPAGPRVQARARKRRPLRLQRRRGCVVRPEERTRAEHSDMLRRLYGTVVWAMADEGITPALRLSREPRQLPVGGISTRS